MSDSSKAPKGAALCGMLALVPPPFSLLWPKSGGGRCVLPNWRRCGWVGGWADRNTGMGVSGAEWEEEEEDEEEESR